ncbi:BT4734/BF3469 family protein [Cesiribacter sp. SM1]|uniref:BT4734/BF3469 family protein n=1 Tax=Cesiribacter sp. SM1 TaxID=2861196 RepID=UPI001CD49A97|nr:BT4734/BF3469 family protein [Cesiribacter sp. SM1]
MKNNETKQHVDRSISIWRNTNSGLSDLNPNPFYKKYNTLNVKQVFEVIKSGGGVHQVDNIKPKIEYIQTHTKQEYEYIKLSLPSFTVSADFEDRRDKKADKIYTQILGFDFDKMSSQQVTQAYDRLKEYPATLLLFKSPSGKGLKVFIKSDCTESEHDQFYRCMALSFKSQFDLDADMQCIDYTRLCFFSYDSDAYLNEESHIAPASEIIRKYKHLVTDSSTSNSEVDSFDYSAVNTENIKSLFDSFINTLQASGVDWIDGQRNKFLLEICKVKKFGISFNECLTELLTFINGRYTNDYNAKSIPEKLAYNWKNYFKEYKPLDSGPVDQNQSQLKISHYLTEQKDLIKSNLLDKRILFIDAPTGSGKTTLVKALASELNLKTDIIMPTTALVEQQADISGITGRRALTVDMVKADVLACCYNSINKIQDRQSKLLVIDEAHSLVSDYGYKSNTIQDIQRQLNNYEYIIYLSGSMLPLEGKYSPENLLSFEKVNRFKYQYQLIRLDEKVSNKDYFISGLEAGKLNVFYKNDKTELDKLYTFLTEVRGLKVAYVSSDKKDRLEYTGITKNASLNGYDVLLTTCVIQAGVNINECDREAVITFGSGSTLIDYVQFTARFRKQVPAIKIIHSGKLGQIQLPDNEELKARMDLELKHLEQAREKNKNRDWCFNAANVDKIVNSLDYVFEDVNGEYQKDSYCLLYNNYQTLNDNIRSNVRVLKHYLEQFNFIEVEADSISIDKEDVKEIKQVGRNVRKEKKLKIESIIDSMFKGTHTFNQHLDSTTDELEKKYIFLSQYLSNDEIKKQNLLTSKKDYDIVESRIKYNLVEKEIKAGNQVSNSALVNYQRLKNLEKQIQVNTTYTNKELKDLIVKAGFTTTSKNYISKSLGVLFDYSASSNFLNYTIIRKL